MFNTHVDAVLVRLVIIGLGNCSCELLKILFGELSGDDIFTFFLQFFRRELDFVDKWAIFAE